MPIPKSALKKQRAFSARTYVFGLCQPETRQVLLQRWREFGEKDLPGFVDAVLLSPGPHILPLMTGDEDVLRVLRTRHLEMLARALSPQTLREILTNEARLALGLRDPR
jgi:hypothetical protein